MKRHGTCIVGIANKQGVWIGVDSCGSTDRFRSARKDTKIVRIGDNILLGVCGSFRVRDVLAYHVTPPEHPKGVGAREYVVRLLVPEIRNALTNAGALSYANDKTESIDGAVILAYDGELFCIEDDLQVGQERTEYCATGSGYEYAFGSLYGSGHIKDARKRIKLALEAAARFSPSVSAPFTVEKL